MSSTQQVYALISLQGYEGESSSLGVVSWLKLGEVSHQVDYTDSNHLTIFLTVLTRFSSHLPYEEATVIAKLTEM